MYFNSQIGIPVINQSQDSQFTGLFNTKDHGAITLVFIPSGAKNIPLFSQRPFHIKSWCHCSLVPFFLCLDTRKKAPKNKRYNYSSLDIYYQRNYNNNLQKSKGGVLFPKFNFWHILSTNLPWKNTGGYPMMFCCFILCEPLNNHKTIKTHTYNKTSCNLQAVQHNACQNAP